jgi:gamma-butyrobetaine dioxygenase
MPVHLLRLLGVTKGTCRIETKCCIFRNQSRAYAQTFGSPLDDFEDARLSQPVSVRLTYRQRRVAKSQGSDVRSVSLNQEHAGPRLLPQKGQWVNSRLPRLFHVRRLSPLQSLQPGESPLPPKSRSSLRWRSTRATKEGRQSGKSPVPPIPPITPTVAHLNGRPRTSLHWKSILPVTPTVAYLNERKSDEIATVQIGRVRIHPLLLRDACTCSKCVDPSSTQKNFQTPQIPQTIKVRSLETFGNGDIHIKWENDIPGFGDDHVSIFPGGSLSVPFLGSSQQYATKSMVLDRTREVRSRLWDVARIKKELQFVNFQDYMTSDKCLWRAVWLLLTQGLMIIRGVPESEKSVEDIALRIGNIRDTFYGRTWDVKSVPDAKNVAYTAQFLGLHMDLLYLANPPGFQFLHCLKSTAKGGASLFADAFQAAESLLKKHRATLSQTSVAYQYQNAGEHYYYTHPVIELGPSHCGSSPEITDMNYSPPFQANYLLPETRNPTDVNAFVKALRAFTKRVENKNHLLEYRLQEGECVIFSNRRILHGRKQFDALGGERWLKGTYVDSDVVRSRFRVLRKAFFPEVLGLDDVDAQFVFERTAKTEEQGMPEDE